MTLPLTASEFKTTRWTLIRQAPSNRADLETLIRDYWNPIYGFIRRLGWRRHDAEELTQKFIDCVMLHRKLIERADPQRGRFRSFIKTAVRNYARDELGRVANEKAVSQPEHRLKHEAKANSDPAHDFDREWAAWVFGRTLKRLEEECQADGMSAQWMVYEARVIRPATHGCEPVPFEALLPGAGVADAQQLYSMLQTMNRKFARMLREVVAETTDESEVEGEIEDLKRALGD